MSADDLLKYLLTAADDPRLGLSKGGPYELCPSIFGCLNWRRDALVVDLFH
jgi:hypothetical protein